MNNKFKKLKNKKKNLRKKIKKQNLKLLLWCSNNNKYYHNSKLNSNNMKLIMKFWNKHSYRKEMLLLKYSKCRNSLYKRQHKWKQKRKNCKLNLKNHRNLSIKLIILMEQHMHLKKIRKKIKKPNLKLLQWWSNKNKY
jgi:hypothetical protein